MIAHVKASDYPDLTPAQVAMLEELFWNGTVRAKTADGLSITVTGSSCLWMHAIDVIADDGSVPPVVGRIINPDTLAGWVVTLEPLELPRNEVAS